MDIRKYGIAIAIAILVAIFIYAMADAVAPNPEYKNCYQYPYSYVGTPPPAKGIDQANCPAVDFNTTDQKTCTDQGGDYIGVQDANQCVNHYECNYCQRDANAAQQSRNAVFFYVAIALGLVGIVIGFVLPAGAINEWVGLGSIFGGVIGLFIGTIEYWNDLTRWLRPVIILLELAVVIFIIYKRMATSNDEKPKMTKKKK